MSVNTEEHVRDYANRMAPKSIRQMPIFSQVGKGLPGDTSKLTFTADGVNSTISCKHVNEATNRTYVDWTLPVTSFVPMLGYEVYEGVREIDEVNMWGWYIRFTYSLKVDASEDVIWSFDTPFTPTRPFNAERVPADRKIS